MQKQLVFLGKCLLICILAFLLFASLLLWTVEYQQACTIILRASGKLHRQQEFQAQYLTLSRFFTLRLILASLLAVYLGAFVFMYREVNRAVYCLYSLVEWVKVGALRRWSGFTQEEKVFAGMFGGFLLLLKTYEVIVFPIFYDEAWTYINMSSKNVLVSMSYYPAPNNHILFSILTNLTVLLPLDPTIALRLPNLLLLPVCYLTLLLILREFFYSKVALLGTVAFMTAYPVALYSMQARGYFLYIWLAVLSIYCTYKMIGISHWRLAVLWIGINALGFYVMPSFLYLFGSVNLFAVLVCITGKDWGRVKQLVISSTATGVLVLILYAPVFLISGISAVANNSYVQKRSLADIYAQAPDHFASTGNWMLGNYAPYEYLVCVLLLLYLVAVAIRNTHQQLLALVGLTVLISPLFIVFLHKVIPFERTWSYCIFPLVLGFCFLVQHIPNYLPIKSRWWYSITAGLVLANSFIFEQVYQRNYALDEDTQQIARVAMQKDFHSFFIASDYQEVLLYYYYLVSRQPYQVNNAQVGDFMAATEKYDCLLLNRSDAAAIDTTQYQKLPVSGYLEVFERKAQLPH